MTNVPNLPITVRFVNGHNKLINFIVSNSQLLFSREAIKSLYDEWLRLKTAIEKYCVSNRIDPDGLQIYNNVLGMVEKMEVQFADMDSFSTFDLKISMSQKQVISALRLTNFEHASDSPSIYFKKDNPDESKPVGFL